MLIFPAASLWRGYAGYPGYENTVPRISLPIGLPSSDIVHTPGFTSTSNARVEYRVIGAPAPRLGSGSLTPVTGSRRP
jgi:hypothetical protein